MDKKKTWAEIGPEGITVNISWAAIRRIAAWSGVLVVIPGILL
jgi:hypothetical protein